MAGPYNLRLEALLAKEESTYGTDPTPAAADDAIRHVGPLWTSIDPAFAFENLRDDVVSNSLVQIAPGGPKGRMVTLDIVTPLIGAGAAYASGTPVRPDTDALFRACGMSRTHVDTGGSESVSYALADTSHGSTTIWAYAGGDLLKIVGCRGDFVWEMTAGGLGRIRWTLQGLLSTAPAETAVPTATYDAVEPPAAVNIGLSIDPGTPVWTPNAAGVSVTPGNNVIRHDDVSAADGIEQFRIASRSPRFTFTPRKPDLSDYTVWAHGLARTVNTIDATLGTTQYNRVDLDIETAYLMTDPQPGEDQGFAAAELEYLLRDLVIRFD